MTKIPFSNLDESRSLEEALEPMSSAREDLPNDLAVVFLVSTDFLIDLG